MGPVAGNGGTPITVVNEDVGGSGAYAFNPAEINVSVGDTVTFTLTAETEFHTFTVEDLDIDQSAGGGRDHEVQLHLRQGRDVQPDLPGPS